MSQMRAQFGGGGGGPGGGGFGGGGGRGPAAAAVVVEVLHSDYRRQADRHASRRTQDLRDGSSRAAASSEAARTAMPAR